MRKGDRNRRYKVKRAYFPVTSEFFDPWEGKTVETSFRFSMPHMTAIEAVAVLTGKDREKAAQVLLMHCVHPDDRDRLERHIREYPAFAQSCANVIMERAIEALRPVISHMMRVIREELDKAVKANKPYSFFQSAIRRFFK